MNILFFTPLSGIWEHSIPESYVAEKFSQEGHDVSYFGCGGGFDYCHVMEARGLKADSQNKQDFCLSCQKTCRLISQGVGASRVFWISDYNLEEQLKFALLSIEASKAEASEMEFEGIPFGRISLYDTVLRFKKQNSELLTEKESKYFRNCLVNSLKSYLAVKEVLKKASFDRVLIYSPQYSVNHSVAYLFETIGVPVYFMEAGTNIHKRLKTLRCWRWSRYYLVNPMLEADSTRIEGMRFTSEDLSSVTNHFMSLLEGRSHMVYSKNMDKKFDFYNLFPAAKGRKVILVTMSSFDEAYSAYLAGLFPYQKANSSVYKDQVDWIKDILIRAASFEDLFFLIRVHPRDFPNKREGGLSDQGRRLNDLFKNLPENIGINFPKDNISIYNLLGFTDVLTTGWSVTALEAGVLGIPVVTYDKNLPSYPDSVMLTGTSSNEYFFNIITAVKKGWSFNQVVNCYKWLSLNHNYGAVQISDSFDCYENLPKPFFLRLVDRCLRLFSSIPPQAIRNRYFKKNIDKNLSIILDMVLTKKNNILEVEAVQRALFFERSCDEILYKKEAVNFLNLYMKKISSNYYSLPPVWEKMYRYLND